MDFIDIVGTQPKGKRPLDFDRVSSISVNRDGSLSVLGNLDHGYTFIPKSENDARKLIGYLENWIQENNKED